MLRTGVRTAPLKSKTPLEHRATAEWADFLTPAVYTLAKEWRLHESRRRHWFISSAVLVQGTGRDLRLDEN